MISKEHVLYHFPDARIEERDLLFHVIVSKFGLGLEESIGNGLTEERAYDEASDWILDYWDCDCEEDDKYDYGDDDDDE